MEFFNRKEEVLEIQLTQEGKRSLAMGKFAPYYYDFFDDDVLYDSTKASFDEEQNSSVPRIKEVPRIKTQTIVYGIETDFNTLKPKSADTKKYLYNKNHSALKYPLGFADYSLNNMPSWNLKLNSGVIQTSSFSINYSPEPDYYENIPQLNCSCSYIYEAHKISDEQDQLRYDTLEQYQTLDNLIFYKSDIFEDKTYYIIREINNIFAVLKEYNATFDKENFDIEVFTVEKVEGQKENLTNLFFPPPGQEQIPTDEEQEVIIPLQSTDVGWYFTIAKDAAADSIGVGIGANEFNPYIDESAINSEEPC